MQLKPLTYEQCMQVLDWRNSEMNVLRTPYFLNEQMQADFYENVVCNRHSNHRYFAIMDGIQGKKFIGMGGITNIEPENRIGEISLIIDPEKRRGGYGKLSADLLLDCAFKTLNLYTLMGECYKCNPSWTFWQKWVNESKYQGMWIDLPNRKFWNGQYYDSMYFSLSNIVYPISINDDK